MPNFFDIAGIKIPVIRCIYSFLTFFGTNRDGQMLRVEAARPDNLGEKTVKYQITYLAIILVVMVVIMS